jgi:hypothetical protein
MENLEDRELVHNLEFVMFHVGRYNDPYIDQLRGDVEKAVRLAENRLLEHIYDHYQSCGQRERRRTSPLAAATLNPIPAEERRISHLRNVIQVITAACMRGTDLARATEVISAMLDDHPDIQHGYDSVDEYVPYIEAYHKSPALATLMLDHPHLTPSSISLAMGSTFLHSLFRFAERQRNPARGSPPFDPVMVEFFIRHPRVDLNAHLPAQENGANGRTQTGITPLCMLSYCMGLVDNGFHILCLAVVSGKPLGLGHDVLIPVVKSKTYLRKTAMEYCLRSFRIEDARAYELLCLYDADRTAAQEMARTFLERGGPTRNVPIQLLEN